MSTSPFLNEDDFFKSHTFDERGVMLMKARPHKYIKRTGTKGNYKYWYKNAQGKLVASDKSPLSGGAVDRKKKKKDGELQYLNVSPQEIIKDFSAYMQQDGSKDRGTASELNDYIDANYDAIPKRLRDATLKEFKEKTPADKGVATVKEDAKESSSKAKIALNEYHQSLNKLEELEKQYLKEVDSGDFNKISKLSKLVDDANKVFLKKRKVWNDHFGKLLENAINANTTIKK